MNRGGGRYTSEAPTYYLHAHCRLFHTRCKCIYRFHTAQSYDGYRALLVIMLFFVVAYIIITFMLGTIREFYDLPLFFWEWGEPD